MKLQGYFTTFEKLLWLFSSTAVIISFLLFDRVNYLSLLSSLIGVTFLILNAKGHPMGQFLTIVFSVLYGVISYTFSYYGEMITYLGMTAPMALVALISWLRHPYQRNHSQVEVNSISRKESAFMLGLSLIVTVLFFFILLALGTANILPSTVSVTTSFIAAYLTFRRNPFFALAYAANDLVLIILWLLATIENSHYVSVLTCFIVFFINDLYGFFNWSKMKKKQSKKDYTNKIPRVS